MKNRVRKQDNVHRIIISWMVLCLYLAFCSALKMATEQVAEQRTRARITKCFEMASSYETYQAQEKAPGINCGWGTTLRKNESGAIVITMDQRIDWYRIPGSQHIEKIKDNPWLLLYPITRVLDQAFPVMDEEGSAGQENGGLQK